MFGLQKISELSRSKASVSQNQPASPVYSVLLPSPLHTAGVPVTTCTAMPTLMHNMVAVPPCTQPPAMYVPPYMTIPQQGLGMMSSIQNSYYSFPAQQSGNMLHNMPASAVNMPVTSQSIMIPQSGSIFCNQQHAAVSRAPAVTNQSVMFQQTSNRPAAVPRPMSQPGMPQVAAPPDIFGALCGGPPVSVSSTTAQNFAVFEPPVAMNQNILCAPRPEMHPNTTMTDRTGGQMEAGLWGFCGDTCSSTQPPTYTAACSPNLEVLYSRSSLELSTTQPLSHPPLGPTPPLRSDSTLVGPSASAQFDQTVSSTQMNGMPLNPTVEPLEQLPFFPNEQFNDLHTTYSEDEIFNFVEGLPRSTSASPIISQDNTCTPQPVLPEGFYDQQTLEPRSVTPNVVIERYIPSISCNNYM